MASVTNSAAVEDLILGLKSQALDKLCNWYHAKIVGEWRDDPTRMVCEADFIDNRNVEWMVRMKITANPIIKVFKNTKDIDTK